MVLLNAQKIFKEYSYSSENELELEVLKYSKQLFGDKSIYLNAKKKIDGRSLGNTIPDGFLFDFSDSESPSFYLVEVELAKHDFYRHIFPQITKFISFFKNNTSQSELIEKIHEVMVGDAVLCKRFLELSNSTEPYKAIKDILDDSQNILIIIDEDKIELKEIMDVYTDTWGKMVSKIIFKRFQSNGEIIYSVNPEFNDIEFSALEYDNAGTELKSTITEESHFEKTKPEIKAVYDRIRSALIQEEPGVSFNPQKYYISLLYNRNVAYFITRKSKFRIVVKQSAEAVSKSVIDHKVQTLSAGVQKFWGGESCEIIIENGEHLEEIIALLNALVYNDKVS